MVVVVTTIQGKEWQQKLQSVQKMGESTSKKKTNQNRNHPDGAATELYNQLCSVKVEDYSWVESITLPKQ